MIDTYASIACVITSIPDALVSPLGAVIALSTSTIAMFGINS